jgi:hypothetical protein
VAVRALQQAFALKGAARVKAEDAALAPLGRFAAPWLSLLAKELGETPMAELVDRVGAVSTLGAVQWTALE